MVFEELIRLSNGDRRPKNPQAKAAPRRLRRARQRQADLQARLKAQNLGAAANQNTSTTTNQKN